jgi:hypothetical protein
MNYYIKKNLIPCILNFIKWLDTYGETSYDHQSFFSGSFGGKAKSFYYHKPLIGVITVAPMIFCEALFPYARTLFWKRQRLPIADAHYAMGFALLSKILNQATYYQKAVHFLEVLLKTRCPGYEHLCWGYPFDWVTRTGTIKAQTPLITTTPYVYEAFAEVYRIDRGKRWLNAMRSIAEHAMIDIKNFPFSTTAKMCSYTPGDKGGVINASAYRAFLLTSAYLQFSEDKYWEVAERNLNFVLETQQSNGSWPYSIDEKRDFIDHFHTCFVIKGLVKIDKMIGHDRCRKAIEKGIGYYLKNLFDDNGLPKPFSKAPRLTVYQYELYDYAECVNLALLLKGKFEDLDKECDIVLNDLFSRWRKTDGSFRSRKLLVGWDNVPMHRWAQSQLFRSLAFLLYTEAEGLKRG